MIIKNKTDTQSNGTYHRQGGGIPVSVTVDEETLTITYKSGRIDYFEHDSHLSGSGRIQKVNGNLFSLIGADLLPPRLHSDSTGYIWEFRRVNEEILASVRWDGDASGFFGEIRTKPPCLDGPGRCARCHFQEAKKSTQPIA